MAERTLSASRFGFGALRERARLLGLGSLTGLVAGMGTFMYINETFLPWGVSATWALVLVAVAGAYTHLLAVDLSESISLTIVAIVVGLSVHIVAWISPLWILSYSPGARDLLLPRMLGEALMSGLLAYLITFYGSYFGAVLLGGYLDP